MKNIVLLPTSELRVSAVHERLYGNEETINPVFFETIQSEGVLTPLIVSQDKFIISGVLRYRAAIALAIPTLPVIITDRPFEEYEVAILNQGRRKTESMRLAEYELLKSYFKVGQGARTDITGKTPKLKTEDALGCSKKHIERAESINKVGLELFGSVDAPELIKIWDDIDSGKKKVGPTLASLQNQLKRKRDNVAPQVRGINQVFTSNYRVYNKDSKDLSELEDESVQTIVCSPPYYKKRDYHLGKDQIGQESDPKEYVRRLVDHFDDCKRVLKKEGSLFVNLGDYIQKGQYLLLPYRFAIGMMDKGWLLSDSLIWLRNNAIFTRGKRTVKCDEVVFHFVKSPNYYYTLDWIPEVSDRADITGEVSILYGKNELKSKPRSVLDFRGLNVIDSNVPSTTWLKKECEARGIAYTHSATFPEIIPEICIRSTSKEGDLVADLYHGSGTCGAIATILRRRYTGFELNPDYINQSMVRLECEEKTISNLLKPAA